MRNSDENFSRFSDTEYEYLNVLSKKKAYRFYVIFCIAVVFATIFAAYIFSFRNDVAITEIIWPLLDGTPLLFVLAGAIAFLSARFLFSYLQPDVGSSVTSKKEDDHALLRRLSMYEKRLSSIDGKYDDLIGKIQSGTIAGELFGKEEKNLILEGIGARLEGAAFDEYFKTFRDKINSDLQYKQKEDVFSRMLIRLQSEVKSQSKRGNVNLILGILTTASGMAVLSYTVFTDPKANDWIEMIVNFFPKFSLVLIVEVFAYFFLRLYKQSLDEIKYFQNEITNIESRYLGLYVAMESPGREGLQSVIEQLAKAERNFILEKGQTTTQIELKKIEDASGAVLTEKIKTALSDLVKIR